MAYDQDLEYVQRAETELNKLFDKYAKATPSEKWLMKPAIKQAAESLLSARLALFKEGTLTTSEDMDSLENLKNEIEAAADAQSTILSAVKLAAMLGVFA
jgi:hypothetical protein